MKNKCNQFPHIIVHFLPAPLDLLECLDTEDIVDTFLSPWTGHCTPETEGIQHDVLYPAKPEFNRFKLSTGDLFKNEGQFSTTLFVNTHGDKYNNYFMQSVSLVSIALQHKRIRLYPLSILFTKNILKV